MHRFETVNSQAIYVLRSKRFALSVLSLVLLIILFFSRYRSTDQGLAVNNDLRSFTGPFQGKSPEERPTRDQFAPELFDIEGTFDGTALRKLCDGNDWREGLYFECSNNSGGIGNMRSFILTCIRKRDPNNLGDLFTTTEPLGYMFDEEFFLNSMHTFCPQMKLVKTRETIPNSQVKRVFTEVVPREMGNHQNNDGSGFDVNRWAGTFRDDLDWWLSRTAKASPSIRSPAVIVFRWAVFFDWPIWLDGPAFANTFGRLLKLRPDVISLATEVLKRMKAADSRLSSPQSLDSLLEFVGVHLRVEQDRLEWWPDETSQIDAYMARIKELDLKPKTTYVATGSATGLEHIRTRLATQFDGSVHSKETLLNGTAHFEDLQKLEWDQQGLVDYCVLLRSRYFLGMFQSSFAQNIAVRRHLLEDGPETLIWRGYHDKWSYLHGRRRSYNGDWVFFSAETMWP